MLFVACFSPSCSDVIALLVRDKILIKDHVNLASRSQICLAGEKVHCASEIYCIDVDREVFSLSLLPIRVVYDRNAIIVLIMKCGVLGAEC